MLPVDLVKVTEVQLEIMFSFNAGALRLWFNIGSGGGGGGGGGGGPPQQRQSVLGVFFPRRTSRFLRLRVQAHLPTDQLAKPRQSGPPFCSVSL